jgi:hypothetical protein
MQPDPATLPDTSTSLSALAEWVRGLPVASLAPVGVLFVAGLLLLCFGRKLLKPVLVLGSIFAGIMVAARLGQAIQPSISPLIWSAAGAIAGLVTAVLSYRLLLGLAMGLIGATVAILLALTAVQLGWINVTSQPPPVRAHLAPGAVDGSEVRAAIGSGVRWPVQEWMEAFQSTAVDRLPPTDTPEARAAIAKELDAVSPGLGGRFLGWLDQANGFMGNAGGWLSEQWNGMPKPMQTLVTASAATGAFLGFVAGAACPTWAAATLTSLLGSLLVLLCGAPLLSRVVPAESLPEIRPLGWLAVWVALGVTGWIFQWVTRPTKAAPRRKAEPETADE